jgi:glucosamine--fructose-6-phosphate aminotransferase (isomerizing)
LARFYEERHFGFAPNNPLIIMDGQMLAAARSWQRLEVWDFVGAGPDYATAWYGRAKVFEAVGQYALHINSEEWLHFNFFIRNPQKIAAVAAASSGNESLSRTKEAIVHMRSLGRPLLIVSDRRWDDAGTRRF